MRSIHVEIRFCIDVFDYLVARIRSKLVVFSAFATFHLNVVGVGCVEETVGRSNGQGGPSCCVAGALQGGARDRDRGFLRGATAGATAEEDRECVAGALQGVAHNHDRSFLRGALLVVVVVVEPGGTGVGRGRDPRHVQGGAGLLVKIGP